MRKFLSFIFIITLLVIVAVPTKTGAAEMTKEKSVSNSAEANFVTFSGCEDVSVGVNITQKAGTVDQKKIEPTAVLSIFASFVDICEFGSSTSFFGTTTVTSSEFVQHGTDDATLNKVFNIAGHEINLSLTWTGVGVIGGEDLKIHDTKGNPKIKKTWDVDNRNAEMTGVFVVDGLNRISDSSLVNAQLEIVKMDSKTISK